MKRAAAIACAAALAVLAAPAAPADAGKSCGGGGGGSGSTGASSSSGGSSGSSSSTPACVDSSKVTGRKHCPGTAFARWNVDRWPRLHLAMGTSIHTFQTGKATLEGTAQHGNDVKFLAVPMEEDTSVVGMTLDMRVTGGINKYFYVGGEANMGGAGIDNPRIQSDVSGHRLEPIGPALYLGIGAVGGVQLPLGKFVIKGETYVGGRFLQLTMQSRLEDCVTSTYAWINQGVIEQRLAFQHWISPWVSANAWIGSNILADNDMSGGVYIQGHIRAFDAAR